MEPFSPVNHFFYSPTISPNMPISLGLTSGFTLHNASQLTKQPFIIGICGGSCSGKSQVTERVKMSLDLSASVINEFDFYFPNLKSDDNFDSPDSIDWDLLTQCLTSLKSYGTFDCPQYNMIKHKKKRKPLKLFPTPIIIVEGLFIFGKEEIRKMIDLSLFIDCPDDVRLGHRVRKFTKEMGMELEFILDYYLKYTKVAYEKYIEPSKVYADIIIPNYGTNYHSKGIDFMVSQIVKMIYGAESGLDSINRLKYAPLKLYR